LKSTPPNGSADTSGLRISVLIPTWNGARTLPALLDAIEAQTRRPDEIVAIDSGSTDGTDRLLAARGARLVSLGAASFNHGTTRNAGVESCGGDLIVLIVQDAVPADANWLAELTRPFGEDARIAGTFARQVPLAHASGVARRNLEGWVAARAEPRTVGPLQADEFRALRPIERLDLCAFDNVCSCIRRDVWQRHRFNRVPIAEDLEWARDVLLDGWKLAYTPAACVRHSHDRSVVYEWRRTYLAHRRLMELFALSTIPSLGGLLTAIATTTVLHARVWSRQPSTLRELGRALALGVAWPLGQYLGARDARRGAPERTFSGV